MEARLTLAGILSLPEPVVEHRIQDVVVRGAFEPRRVVQSGQVVSEQVNSHGSSFYSRGKQAVSESLKEEQVLTGQLRQTRRQDDEVSNDGLDIIGNSRQTYFVEVGIEELRLLAVRVSSREAQLS